MPKIVKSPANTIVDNQSDNLATSVYFKGTIVSKEKFRFANVR